MESKKAAERLEKTTLKSRFGDFFFFIIGIVMLLSGSILVYSESYHSHYRHVIDSMSYLNDYTVHMENAMDRLKLYTKFSGGQETDFYKIQAEGQSAQAVLKQIADGGGSVEFLRKIQGISNMSECFLEQTEEIYRSIQLFAAGQGGFSQVNEGYQEICSIYEAMSGAGVEARSLFFDYADTFQEEMDARDILFKVSLLFIVALSCSLILFRISRIYRSIVVPIQELLDGAARVGSGIFEPVKVMQKGMEINNDISMLIDRFNRMTVDLKSQICLLKENMQIQKELEKSRFRELQMQINPHFMFNTLNMIAETAYLEHAEKTGFLLNRTAKMFRFHLDFSGAPVTIHKELEELENYILIQEEQYEGRIKFFFRLDESFHMQKVPSLTLQPLIENAITHGIGKRIEGGSIQITTRYDAQGQEGYLVIEDDGAGMPPERLAEVIRDMKDPLQKRVKIGLGNVYSRLKMMYGEDFSMEVKSEEKMGTRVTIRLRFEEVGTCTD